MPSLLLPPKLNHSTLSVNYFLLLATFFLYFPVSRLFYLNRYWFIVKRLSRCCAAFRFPGSFQPRAASRNCQAAFPLVSRKVVFLPSQLFQPGHSFRSVKPSQLPSLSGCQRSLPRAPLFGRGKLGSLPRENSVGPYYLPAALSLRPDCSAHCQAMSPLFDRKGRAE